MPPFLARLRGQHQGQQSGPEGGPDPILAARRRPAGRVRTASEEAEDAPVVLDEQGNVVRLGVGEDGAQVVVDGESGDLVVKEGDGRDESGGGGGEEKKKNVEGKNENETEKVAGIGAGKKRKVGRVVGGDEAADGDDNEGEKKNTKPSTKAADTPTAAAKQPKKKKAKKIKLSFGDDDEGE